MAKTNKKAVEVTNEQTAQASAEQLEQTQAKVQADLAEKAEQEQAEPAQTNSRLQVMFAHPVKTESISIGDYIESDMLIPSFQRDANQWTTKMCWSLLDTIRKGKIIPSVAVGVYKGETYLLDGLQRMTALKYLDSALTQALEDAETDESKERLSTLYDKFLATEIVLIKQDYDNWQDMVETFESLNSGKPLNTAQKSKGKFCKPILDMLEVVKKNEDFIENLRHKQQTAEVDGVKQYGQRIVPNLEKLAVFVVNAYLNKATTSLGVATKNLAKATEFDSKKMPYNVAEINRRLSLMGNAYSSYDEDSDRKIITKINAHMIIVSIFSALADKNCQSATPDDIILAINSLYDSDGNVKVVKVKQKGFTINSKDVFAAGSSNSVTETDKKVAIIRSLIYNSICIRRKAEEEEKDALVLADNGAVEDASKMAEELLNEATV